MTTLQLNAELYRQLSYIADDKNLMQKVVNYVKRLTRERAVGKGTDTHVVSDEDVLNDLNHACKELKDYRSGKIKLQSADTLINEL